ncbi:transposase, partial [Flintibacter porci]|uniref:transposase n=1 Tax=Flintibacter porci TaxID=3342383 RepID=UPI003F8A3A9C
EQILDVIHAADVCHLQQLTDLFPTRIFFRGAILSGHTALDALDTFAERWDKKYPKISQSWRDNWPNLSTYFKYPQEVRRLIYTTNAIEGFNRQLRKVTKAKSVFPTDDSPLKMLYLAMIDITKKWTGRRQDWSMIHAQLAVFFADRMPE